MCSIYSAYMGGLCGAAPRLRREKQARLHPKGGACDENKSAPYVSFRVATNYVTLVNLRDGAAVRPPPGV